MEVEGARGLCDEVARLRAAWTDAGTVDVRNSAAISAHLHALGELHAQLASLRIAAATTTDERTSAAGDSPSSAGAQLSAELALVGRVAYRGKNQHRRAQHYQKLCEARKRMRALCGECAPHASLAPWAAALRAASARQCACGAPSLARLRRLELPAPAAAASALAQLACIGRLAECARVACERAGRAGAELLGHAFFMPFALVTVAAAARLWAFAAHAERVLVGCRDALVGLCAAAGPEFASVCPTRQQQHQQQQKQERTVASAPAAEKRPKETLVQEEDDVGEAVDSVSAVALRTQLALLQAKPKVRKPAAKPMVPAPKPAAPPAPAVQPKPSSAADIFGALLGGKRKLASAPVATNATKQQQQQQPQKKRPKP